MDIDGLGEKQVALFQRLGLVRTAADFYRLDARAAARARRLRRGQRRPPAARRSRRRRSGRSASCCSRSASRASATSPAATSRSTSARSTRCWPPRRSRSPRRPGIGPMVAELIHSQLDELRAADRRPARRPALRGGGPAAGRGAAGGQDVRAHRHAARPHARGGDGADPRAPAARSPAASPRRRATSSPAPRRAPSSRRPSGSACPCSTSPGCWRCSRMRCVARSRARLDAVAARALAQRDGLDELAAAEVQRRVVVGGVAGPELAAVHQAPVERAPLRFAVVVRAGTSPAGCRGRPCSGASVGPNESVVEPSNQQFIPAETPASTAPRVVGGAQQLVEAVQAPDREQVRGRAAGRPRTRPARPRTRPDPRPRARRRSARSARQSCVAIAR